jgi:dolichol-phosphate mannosyltransferase
MKLLLAVPAYNEAGVIVPTLEAVAQALSQVPGLSWHIMAVDNASTDGTAQKVRERALPNTSAVTTTEKGKGAALRLAAGLAADADLFGFIDADLSAHPSSIPLLLGALERGADIAIGSRLLNPAKVRRGVLRTATSEAFNFVRKLALGIKVADSQCGLKIMNRKGIAVLQQCKEAGWFLDIELLARAQQKGLRILEVPIAWDEHHYQGRESKLSLLTDSIGALRAIWRIKRRLTI